MTKDEVVAIKVALLKSKGNDARLEDDRLVLRVDDSKVGPEDHALFRRMWGPEWPVVRSARWHPPYSPADQLLFHSYVRS